MIMSKLLPEVAHLARGRCIMDGARSPHPEEIITFFVRGTKREDYRG
jgi:hypothetical protein